MVSLDEEYEFTFRGAANFAAAESIRAFGYQGLALGIWVDFYETIPLDAMTGTLFSPMMSRLYEKHTEAQLLEETGLERRIENMITALQNANERQRSGS